MNINLTTNKQVNSLGLVMWAFLLCIAWFGHFNEWWPIALPIVFTAIVCALYFIKIVLTIIAVIIGRDE